MTSITKPKMAISMVSALMLLVLIFATGSSAMPPAAGDGGDGGLFSEPGVRAPTALDDPATSRSRVARVQFDVLGGEEGPPHDGSGLGERVVLNLFDDTVLIAVLDRVESNPTGGYTWIGHVEGVDLSHVILVINEGAMAGKVAMPSAVYTVSYAGGPELHVIAEIEQEALGQELDPIPVDAPPGRAPAAPAAPEAASDGSLIDLMVVYTADARSNAGGTAAMENEIILAVAEANAAYANSQVSHRVWLAHMAEVTYTETGNSSTDLNALRGGSIPNVHTWRNTYHTDHVAMVTQTGGCGLGSFQSSVNPAFEASAYFVLNRGCLTGNLTLPHELGHNMGGQHDWYVDSAVHAFTYSHGYANLPDTWRTIMAYNDWCDCSNEVSPCPAYASRVTKGSPYCTRLLYVSNPAVSYGGDPMGVAGGSSTGCAAGSYAPDPGTCDADSKLTFDQYDANCDGFRDSAIAWTGATSTDWNTASNWQIEEGATGSKTTVNRVPRTIDDIVIPSSPPGARWPTIASGTVDARDVLIETGAQLNMNGGTLNVHGQWEEQGTGTFGGTGGTVAFVGILNQSIETNSGSAFYNLEIGDGTGTQTVTASSDLDVNGNLTIQAGASLEGGTNTIRVAGSWADNGTSFVADTSTVVFDGASQAVSKATNVVIDEDFSSADDSGCCNFYGMYSPPGWVRITDGNAQAQFWMSSNPYPPNVPDTGNGVVYRFGTSNTAEAIDAWLMTHGVDFKAGSVYRLSYKYGTRYGNPQDLLVYYGPTQMTDRMTLIGGVYGVTNTTWQTAEHSFTVSTDGTYYLGFRSYEPAPSTSSTRFSLDDVSLTTSNLIFYDLEVGSSGGCAPNQDVKVLNNLTVDSGAMLDLSTNDAIVEGTVTNNGTLKQTKTVGTSETVEFLQIGDGAGGASYRGASITTDASNSLGSTTVAVSGNQICPGGSALGQEPINRCFDVVPTATSNIASTLRLYYLPGELNGNSASTVKIYHYNNGLWNEETGTYDREADGGDDDWVQVSGVDEYSPFAAGDDDPTAEVLASFTAKANEGHVQVAWETISELETAGFYMVRSKAADGEYQRLNASLIPARGGPTQGASYAYDDADVVAGETYYYKLEQVDEHGGSTFHGPVEATVGGMHEVYLPLVVR